MREYESVCVCQRRKKISNRIFAMHFYTCMNNTSAFVYKAYIISMKYMD